MKGKFTYLVVDDENTIVKIITDILNIHPETSHIYTAHDGEEALKLYQENRIDIVITDVIMPRMTGIDLIHSLKKIDQDVQVIVQSAFSDIELIRDAMRSGAYDYVIKPFTIDDMMVVINRILERIRFINEKKQYIQDLERKVEETTHSLKSSFLDTLSTLITALEARDQYTHRHSQNVSSYAFHCAKEMGWSTDRLENIREGAILHDIGKIGIPDSILLKPAGLTKEEYAIVKEHPAIGKNIVFPSMHQNKDIINFINSHHERFDGTGYPQGLKGKEVPEIARIANLADSFDAMTTDREYRKKMSTDAAIEDIKKNKEKQFDPEIADIFITIIERIKK